ncbi:prepilin-type N-terminal cleavage/methylation domain-containing protein [bacterium]|nr:prepilin-type N-terminal cleavage/methylation domain-containing protein [bacterium]
MNQNKSFTLIELLVVIALFALLLSIVIIHVKNARQRARIAKILTWSKSIHSRLGANIVGEWKFDEGTGNIAYDSSGNHDINLNGEWTDGVVGNAYRFVGSGWVVTDFGEGIGKGVTYEFWFKLPDTSDIVGTFLCAEDADDTSLEDNLGQTNYGDRGCGVSWLNSDFNVSDTNWHHFVFSKSSDSQLCLDGECKSMGDATGNIPNIKKIIFNGGCGCGTGNFSQGIIIDELRIYAEALPEQAIREHYLAGLKKHQNLTKK